MIIPAQHIETLKHIGDVASGSALVAGWLGMLAGFAQPIGTIAATVWFIFRAIDTYWTFRDRLAQRRKAKAEKAKS